jgi:hypothetical protein
MPAGQYHIFADQGSTFKLFVEYQTSGNTAIDLKNYSANLQVRRNSLNENVLLHFSGTTLAGAVTGGGSTGSYTGTGGIAGSGGITLNSGPTGATGYTGGIFILADATTMKNIPSGRHFYNLELTNNSEVSRILEGRFEVDSEVVR